MKYIALKKAENYYRVKSRMEASYSELVLVAYIHCVTDQYAQNSIWACFWTLFSESLRNHLEFRYKRCLWHCECQALILSATSSRDFGCQMRYHLFMYIPVIVPCEILRILKSLFLPYCKKSDWRRGKQMSSEFFKNEALYCSWSGLNPLWKHNF